MSNTEKLFRTGYPSLNYVHPSTESDVNGFLFFRSGMIWWGVSESRNLKVNRTPWSNIKRIAGVAKSAIGKLSQISTT